jgi:hypothetical protein
MKLTNFAAPGGIGRHALSVQAWTGYRWQGRPPGSSLLHLLAQPVSPRKWSFIASLATALMVGPRLSEAPATLPTQRDLEHLTVTNADADLRDGDDMLGEVIGGIAVLAAAAIAAWATLRA